MGDRTVEGAVTVIRCGDNPKILIELTKRATSEELHEMTDIFRDAWGDGIIIANPGVLTLTVIDTGPGVVLTSTSNEHAITDDPEMDY